MEVYPNTEPTVYLSDFVVRCHMRKDCIKQLSQRDRTLHKDKINLPFSSRVYTCMRLIDRLILCADH